MQLKYAACYVPALYATVGIFLTVNLLALMEGIWITLLPIALQTLVIMSVHACKTWAYVVVRVWSAFCVVSGTAFWLVVLLRGGFSHSAGYTVYETLLLLMGVFFFKNAKVVLSERVHMDAGLQAMRQEDI
jgi:hypothetical protein